MNIDHWISCTIEAYKIIGGTFSPHKEEMLLEKLPEDVLNIDKVTRHAFKHGLFAKDFVTQDKSLDDVIEETKETITSYFFRKVALGETFGSISRIKEGFGNSVEENYNLSSGLFVDMAKTYWTYKIEVGDLFPKYHNLVLPQVLLEVERAIASVFFPTPGPMVIWVRQRREKQRQLLEQYAPEIDIDAFLKNNPILGTSRGPISKRVFNERISIRCQNSNCSQMLKIPNTVKVLQVTCPKCRTSFRFPARDFKWLNHLPPDLHPELSKVDELENLRQLYDIPHKIFALRILGSPWATRQVQENIYARFREKMPKASEKELLKAVFVSRVFPHDPFGYEITEEEIDKVMESIDSLEDLITYFIGKDEAEELTSPDSFGIGARIDDVLSR